MPLAPFSVKATDKEVEKRARNMSATHTIDSEKANLLICDGNERVEVTEKSKDKPDTNYLNVQLQETITKPKQPRSETTQDKTTVAECDAVAVDDGESVCIWYMKDGVPWAIFLGETLTDRYDIPTKLIRVGKGFEATVQFTVNVILVTPLLLESGRLKLIEALNAESSVLILTGVTKDEFKTGTTQVKSLQKWNIHELNRNEESVRDMRLCIIGLYERRSYALLPAPRQVNELVTTYWKVSFR